MIKLQNTPSILV